jgi:Flagellar motor protein
MARKKRGGDVGEGANWMDTYGDLVTLLLCFFVLLYSFSTVDAEKWEELVGAFSGLGIGVNAIPAMDMRTVVDSPIALEIDTSLANTPHDPSSEDKGNGVLDLSYFYALVDSLSEFIEENNLSASLFTQEDTLTVTLRINENTLFDSGDATLKTTSYAFLDDLAELFAEQIDIINAINIEGHTDTDPIRTSQYEDNWDLSTKRATNAARYIMEANTGVDAKKLIPQGMGEYHPVATNSTAEGKAMNRRVDFVIQSVTTGIFYVEGNFENEE